MSNAQYNPDMFLMDSGDLDILEEYEAANVGAALLAIMRAVPKRCFDVEIKDKDTKRVFSILTKGIKKRLEGYDDKRAAKQKGAYAKAAKEKAAKEKAKPNDGGV